MIHIDREEKWFMVVEGSLNKSLLTMYEISEQTDRED